MIEVKRACTQPRPRSGLNQSESVSQGWAGGAVARPLGRASDHESTSDRPPSRSGYRPSAARTISTLASLMGLVFVLAHSNAFAQEPAPVPAASPMVSAQQSPKVPSVVIDYRADANRPLPSLSRVGVETNDQQPLTLREAIALALVNNKDIEVARDSVKIAEYDLLSMHGAYDPRLSAQSYYERIKTPAASFLSGASNAVEARDFTATTRLEGLTPKYGGNYRLDFSSVRSTSNSLFTALNPQYPTALTFSYTQPLVRGLRFDLPRRQIEVAKKNLSLTDAQFRERAIEVITSVQRSYWDLVFALRNLQIQRNAVFDARTQLDHNRRMVAEGSLAPIDVVAAETQVANFEQAEFTALEDVNRAENNLKNLIAENQQSPLWNASVVPTHDVDLMLPQVSLPDAMKAARENRQELKQSDLAREINQLDQKLYRDQTKPQVDLAGSYGVVGNAGTVTSSTSPFTASSDQLRPRLIKLSFLPALHTFVAPPATTISPDLIGG